MRRVLLFFLLLIFFLPAQGCFVVLGGNTTRVVKPINRHHKYYDHVKDRKKKRTRKVLMKS